MKKLVCLFAALLFAAPVFTTDALAQSNKWEDLVEECDLVLKEMVEMPEGGIPKSLLRDCKGIVIIPNTIGGGFIFGGKYGQGVILSKNNGKWSSPAVFNLGGASFGWQIGGQATDIILLVMADRGIDGILKGKLKLGGDASVAAGPFGREAEASTDIQLKSGILSYSRSRGLFIGLKLEGAVITQNTDANDVLYGGHYSASDILKRDAAKPTPAGLKLMADLSRYSR